MAGIQKRGKSYRITVSCGYDIYGKKIIESTTYTPDPTLSPKKQEKAVQDFAIRFENRVKNGYAMDGRKITLKEFAERWLKEYAAVQFQSGTVEKYTYELRERILPALGHIKLSDLKPPNLNSFFTSMLQDGARKDGKAGGYSKSSVAKTRNVLSSVLRTAVDWDLIEKNPLEKVHPKAEDAAEKVKFFTPEQVSLFLDYIEQPYTVRIGGHQRIDDTGKPYTVGEYEATHSIPEQIRLLFILAVYTGFRKGELLALQWSDLDEQKDTIRVSKSVTMVNGKPVCKAPKTKTSNRTVTIPHSLMERLLKLRDLQEEHKQKSGSYWQDEGWIFTQDNGKMMNYSTPYHALQDAIRRYNADKGPDEQLPYIPFHGLRHTSATLLIASQQDLKTVSRRLGHAQTSTTMNIYAHALEENDQKAADVIDAALKKRF